MEAGASMRCKELTAALISLGFEVRDGKSGHKICVHDYLPGFDSIGYNCGHGRNGEIKRIYISKILKLLNTHEADFVIFLEGSS